MKYTQGPAPWQVDFSGRFFDKGVIRMNGQVVAKLSDDVTISEEARTANGHLLAAAPELYEALKAALPYLRRMDAEGMQCALPVSNVIRAAEGVLRIAEGKE